MRKILLFSFLVIFTVHSNAQQTDSVTIKKFFNEALTNSVAYKNLDKLVNTIGGRLAGSPEAARAVEWAKQAMIDAGADTVWLQEVWVPHWVRGEKEKGMVQDGKGMKEVPVCALGMSIGTPDWGVSAPLIEVKSFDELKKLGTEKIKGKIVFYNHPFDQTFINTFDAYSEAGKYRWAGASEAARYGAVASIVRSMAINQDDFPHTGAMGYNDSLPKIPAAAVSTNGAEVISQILKTNPEARFYLKQSCKMMDSVLSYNVIGEIKGSEHPEEIIDVGGHLDSWETGKGATDDGTGVAQSIEVLRLFKTTGVKPKRTIRAIAFMNEENGLKGGKKYGAEAERKKEKHIAAMESDAGGFTPHGFGLNMKKEQREKVLQWKSLLLPYGLWSWDGDGDGADISPITDKGVPGFGLSVDSQRYFDLHHAASDTFDKVNRRELELGAASMAAMIYLISQYGL
ncbi:MAG: M20/M25/M40 family metallo-hydrolase [Bacteroidetes bacterium]|nr:M20/M25/M40 family metallo-hydrolase [Bacteroidota bacterium]